MIREAEKLLEIYVTSDVAAQRIEFLEAINLGKGERVLDEGTGPGFLPRTLAGRINN